MNRELNWNYLYYFYVTLKQRSVRLAAAEIDMAPSTLSEAIRSLEAQLGTKLLARTTRKVEPTDAGKALFDKIKNLYEERADIFNSVGASIESTATIAVGIVPSNGFISFVPMIASLTDELKSQKLIFKSCAHEGLEKLLESGDVDLGLTVNPVRIKSAESHIWLAKQMAFHVHKDLAGLPLADLVKRCKIGLLGSDDSSLDIQNKLIRGFPEHRFGFLISDYPSVLIEACHHGRAMIVCPADCGADVVHKLSRVQDRRLDSFFQPIELYIAWARRIEGSALHTFVKRLTTSNKKSDLDYVELPKDL